jgi:hypothetical protein
MNCVWPASRSLLPHVTNNVKGEAVGFANLTGMLPARKMPLPDVTNSVIGEAGRRVVHNWRQPVLFCEVLADQLHNRRAECKVYRDAAGSSTAAVTYLSLRCHRASAACMLRLCMMVAAAAAGCTDMLVADLTELPAGTVSWKKVCSVPPGSPLSSEGVSLL